MTLVEAIISGTVQGITEFLPISSSGHLVLLHRYLNISESGIFFDICLHVGTLAAVLLYFSKEILAIIRERNTFRVLCIAVATIPAIVAAFFFEGMISSFFMDPKKVALMLIVTGFVLFAGQFGLRAGRSEKKDLTVLDSLLIGIAQAFSLLPGLSRSGATISTGLVRGMKAETAFTFSFLLAIPAIIGAVLYNGMKKISRDAVLVDDPVNYIAGMVTAFVVGLICLPLLLKVVKRKRLYIFGIYCLVLGIGGIFF